MKLVTASRTPILDRFPVHQTSKCAVDLRGLRRDGVPNGTHRTAGMAFDVQEGSSVDAELTGREFEAIALEPHREVL